MRWRYILSIVGILVAALGLTMIFPLMVGIFYRDNSILTFSLSILITFSSGLLLYLMFRGQQVENITQREGMAIVAISWSAVGLFGSIPFYLEGGEFRLFVDAFFESVSGFTTTGSSILVNIEGVSKGVLFWRSLIQWLGGMGIIVLSIAILPFLGVGGMQLYKAEAPTVVVDKLKPRIRETAIVLWKVYVMITIAEIVLLFAGGMSLYDSACHAFTTMPTGGFSTKNASLAHFNSVYFDVVILVFMFLVGINFTLHYQFLTGNTLSYWKNSEFKFFFGTAAVFTVIIMFDIHGAVYESLLESLRFSSFQVVSVITTTGYITADYEKWPAMSQLILLFCMFLGASAGSTGGGMKCLRIMLCCKFCYKELFSLIHPHAIKLVKISGRSVPDDIMRSVMGFLALYIGLFAISTVLLAGLGVDFVTAIGAVAATIGNIGPGFGMVGPVENFASIPFWGKWLLIWCMLLGRLEIYTVIILMVPEFWRK